MKMTRGRGRTPSMEKCSKNAAFTPVEKELRKEGKGIGDWKSIVVGIRMDNQSRELLTWALVKAADSGDRVLALHVLPSSAAAAGAASPADELDAMLAVYEGFCNLKQIDLKLRVCKGSSIRKVLVREAKASAALKLILGVNKNSRSNCQISIAKYCAKKLPSSCSVIALSNGKIVFQREIADNSGCQKKCSKGSTKRTGREERELYCLLPMAGLKGFDAENSSPSITPKSLLNISSIVDLEDSSSFAVASPTTDGSICLSQSASPGQDEPKDENASALVLVENSEAPSSPACPAIRKLQTARHCWPLIRRLLSYYRRSVSSENTKTSALPWGTHPDSHKSTKSNWNVTPDLDQEKGVVVPVGDELTPSSFLLNDGRGRLPEELESLKQKYSSVCRLFSYEELMQATSNTLPENLIGKGGSSSVYRGILSDGKELAVKILKPSEGSIKEFVREVEIITALRHRNIISLLGFCLESNNLILVYDYLSRGSLEDTLHVERVSCSALSWNERYKIAIGVAQALEYLHGGGSGDSIIHRDVKTSNILLSEDCEPQLSDFGLAKRASESSALLSASDRAGTFGYLAPEFFLYGKVNEKTDVYAFGVVLLELLSGRKPISIDGSKGQENLVMWAKPTLQSAEVSDLIDPRLNNDYDSDQVEQMRLAAFLCIRRLHQARPKMALVLRILQGDDEALKWARLEVETPEGLDGLDEQVTSQKSDILSHINLALLDVEDDLLSNCSTGHTVDSLTASTSIEDFLQYRWSRSSSFD